MRVLYANNFSWSQSKRLRTTDQNDNSEREFNIKIEALSFSEDNKGTVMPTDGLFVGLIVFVGTNNNNLGTTTYKVVRTPRIGGGYDKNDDVILGFVDVPPLETGCFYSDPDTSDAVRQYLQYDNIQFRTVKDAGGVGAGCTNVTVLLGMETETNLLVGPYETNFNF